MTCRDGAAQVEADAGVLPIDDTYSRVLARADLELASTGPWTAVGQTDRVQGWKLHLSSVPVEAVALLERVVPLFEAEGVSFKFAATESMLGALNEGSFGDTQVGKFVTIYPGSNEQARRLATVLVRETAGFHGPIIVTDLRLGDVLYARYGGFRPVIAQDRLGQRYAAIRASDGTLRPDEYTIPFKPPPGVPNPFSALLRRRRLADGGKIKRQRLLGPGFLPVGVLSSHPKGCVFLALDLRTQADARLRVLKQGRQYCLADRLGRDIRTRLRHQGALSRVLASVMATPAADDYFELGGHGYLPLEFIEGKTLLDSAATVQMSCSWADLPRSERRRLLGHARGVAEHIAAMHSAGFVHRDLSPTNILVSRDGEVFLIDLELAQAIDDSTPPFGKGTPGYMSPEQEVGALPAPAQDVFGLGALLALLLCGCDPRLITAETTTATGKRLAAVATGAARPLIDLTAACLAPTPNERPGMTEIVDALSHAQGRGHRAPTRRRLVGTRLKTTIRAGVRAVLDDAPRDPSTGLWLSQIDPVDRPVRTYDVRSDAHHGVAGVVYALARLVRLGYVSRDAAARDVVPAIRWLLAQASTDPGERLPGLFFGDAGIAVALLEARDSGFDVGLEEVADVLSRSLAAPLDWLDVTHGAAGQAIAAIRCRELLDDVSETVKRLSHRLVETQQPDGSWRVPEGVAGLSGQTLTGFAHGCAGIVYLLSACAASYGGESEAEAAERGAEWLIGNAHSGEREVLEWDYSDALGERWRWWCHGGPGIALAFLALFRRSGEARYADVATRALGIHRADVRSTNLSTCHGLAGLGEIYLEAAKVLDDRRWRGRAEAVASTLLGLARPAGAGGSTWLVEDPYAATADLMVGTAGVLHFLARLDTDDPSLAPPLLLPSTSFVSQT